MSNPADSNYFSNLESSSEAHIAASECLQTFDADKDGHLNKRELNSLLEDLFDKTISDSFKQSVFNVADRNKKGRVSVSDLCHVWTPLIKPMYAPKCCLLNVDVQNDFISGSLALSACPAKQDAQQVIPVINKLIQEVRFSLVVYSLDWHPSDHCSFIDNVDKYKWKHEKSLSDAGSSSNEVNVFDTVIFSMEGGVESEQKLWPVHCVQDTWGAELHDQLLIAEQHEKVYKGVKSTVDSYSAFKDASGEYTKLQSILRERGVTHVFVTGLAYDVCVAATARDCLSCGFVTYIVDDACKGVTADGIEETKRDFTARGGIIVHSDKVPDIVKGRHRQVEAANFLCNQMKA